MSKYWYFIVAQLGFLAGVGIADGFSIHLPWWLCFGIVIIFVPWPKIRLIGIIVLFWYLGTLRYWVSVPEVTSTSLAFYNEQKVQLEGMVCSVIDERIDTNKFTVCIDLITIKNKKVSVSGRVLVTTRLYPGYAYGDRLSVQGRLEAPEAFNGFQYDEYLARYHIYSLMYRPSIQVLDHGRGDIFHTYVYNLRLYLLRTTERILPQPEAGLLNAFLFGDRGKIPPAINNYFVRSGVMHLVAISGSHITLFAGMILAVTLRLDISRHRASWIIGGVLFLYCLIIGAPASAVRAAIMAGLSCVALRFGRLQSSLYTLLCTASIMVVCEPKILLHDIGFQLSFAAIWGMMVLTPVCEPWCAWLTESFGIREIVAMTVSATAATLPLQLYYFGNLSIVALAANIALVPFFSALIIFGLAALGVVSVFAPLGLVVFFPAYILCVYMIRAAEFFSRPAWAAIPLAISGWGVFGMYAVLLIFLYGKNYVKSKK